METMTRTTEEMKKAANDSMARYPQYIGHFDAYIPVRVNRDVKTKMGLSFRKGDITIAMRATYHPDAGPYTNIAFRTVWSERTMVDTSVRESWLTVL